MNNLQPSQPIGIFDSGIGGLTVAKAVVDLLPNENIIYFGDTAHLPYGDKSKETICEYSKKIADFLLSQSCKLILIACNSASAAAYDELKKYIGNQALLINVIDPVVNFIAEYYANKKIGLIGTRQTIQSEIYQKKLQILNSKIHLQVLATPVLVPAIEEGFHQHKIIDDLLVEYLSRPLLKNIDTLILGCTHYPIIKDRIKLFYKNKIDIIDAPTIVAKTVKNELEKNLLQNKNKISKKYFYLSDYTETFAAHAQLFFQKDIVLLYENLT